MKMLSLLLFVLGVVSAVAAPFTFGASGVGAIMAFLLSRALDGAAA